MPSRARGPSRSPSHIRATIRHAPVMLTLIKMHDSMIGNLVNAAWVPSYYGGWLVCAPVNAIAQLSDINAA